jgi:hypothetical protein
MIFWARFHAGFEEKGEKGSESGGRGRGSATAGAELRTTGLGATRGEELARPLFIPRLAALCALELRSWRGRWYAGSALKTLSSWTLLINVR